MSVISKIKVGGTIYDIAYPVGSIYLSVSDTSPAELFGGTWEQIKDRFLLAAGDTYAAGSTGGEAQHPLTEAEMPEHIHKLIRQQWHGDDKVHSAFEGAIFSWKGGDGTGGNTSYSYEGNVEPSGGSQPHNNMPPYLTVYMWKRIA